jgi:hypothetical protein
MAMTTHLALFRTISESIASSSCMFLVHYQAAAIRECWIWAWTLTFWSQISDVLDSVPSLWTRSIVIRSPSINSTNSYP